MPTISYNKVLRERKALLRCTDYLAHDRFLLTSCWRKTGETTGELYGEQGQYRKHCVVVGQILAEDACLHPGGDFSETSDDTPLSEARYQFTLAVPEGVPGFEDDFKEAMHAMCILSCVIPGCSNTVLGPTPKLSLRFQSRIFEEIPAREEYYTESYRTKIDNYPLPNRYTHLLEDMKEDHRLRSVEMWKDNMHIFPEDLHNTLVNNLVKVAFYVSYDTELGGLEANVLSLDVIN